MQQPFTQNWNLQIHVTGKLSQLRWELVEGKGFVVSNGSFWYSAGAVAWIIKGATGTNCIQGSCLTPSAPEDYSAFRSKLTGLFGILFNLSCLVLEPSQEVPFMMVCDGKSVLQWVQSTNYLSPSKPNYDLILAVWNLVVQLPFLIHWQHVKCHEDDKKIMAFSWEAWLNIEADLSAKQALNQPQRLMPTQYDIPFSAWGVCYLSHKRVVKQFAWTIWTYLSSPDLEKYWKEKKHPSNGLWEMIDWESLQHVYTEFSTVWRQWVANY